ncbi:MAG: hypothetical protein ACFFBC_15295 [Promethearchaeota archaeon]
MGRKKKFGEESDFVSVRVPKSKRKEYRDAIKNFVEKKFATESEINGEVAKVKVDNKKLDGFRKFEEFVKDIKNLNKIEIPKRNKDK